VTKQTKKKKKGLLISFEGGEGSGKTTQICKLRRRLTKEGLDVVVLREPGGTAISEQIRNVVLSPKNVGMAFTTEVFLFQAARSQIYREIVLPSLKAGKIVLMDRSRDSSVVYQGMVRGFGKEMIEKFNDISTKKTYPDITILLDIPVKVGLSRKVKIPDINRFEMENMEFHEKIRKVYLNLAKGEAKKRWLIVDANRSIEAMKDDIWKLVKNKLKI